MIKLINLLEISSSDFRTKIKTLGHSEKGSELTSGGELNPKLLDILSPFLDEWTKIGGNGCKLQFTSGNDKLHQDRNNNSKHKIGNAVDVTLSTSCHIKFTELLNTYVKKYPGFTYLDEYKKPSPGAVGHGHFHINIGGGNTNTQTSTTGGTPTDTTKSNAFGLLQAAFKKPLEAIGMPTESIKSNDQILTENFVNPQPDSNSSTIVSPYDGDIVETDPSVCNGKIRIKHNINALSYYTEFCNVNRIKVRTGEFIRQNEVIGDLGDNNLKVYVYDNTGKKHSVSEFIKTSNEKTIDPKTADKADKADKYDKSSNYTSKSKYPGLYTLPFNAVLAPLTIFNNMMSYKGKKKKVEEDEKINEEINRIKKLLK
jgi:hypothetical protein